MSSLWLLLRNLLFTALVPGFVVGWVPLHWFERHAQWPESWGPREIAAAAVFGVGVIVFVHCQWLFAVRGQGTPAPIDPPKKFVRRGLYKWVRNPMYLALLALVGAQALFFASWHIAVYFICLTCFFHVLVMLLEEESLRRRFGAMYEDYRREVPRWLPRKPRPSLQTVPPFPTGKR